MLKKRIITYGKKNSDVYINIKNKKNKIKIYKKNYILNLKQKSSIDIDNNKIYPASFDLENMIVVSSSTLFGDLAKGSNFGIESVDFLVNGEQLEVVDHRGVRSITSGSSYAAPRVAAMAARYFAKNPDSKILEFKLVLIKRAIKKSNNLVKYGWIPDPLDNYLF